MLNLEIKFNNHWLSHLPLNVISGIEGNYLDAYVIALEGWRRGLVLKWHHKDSEPFKHIKKWSVNTPGQLFSLHTNEKSHYFFRTRGDKVSTTAVEQGMDKEVTKKMLKSSGVPVPEGRQFTITSEADEILQYISRLGYPVVIKPVDGSFGRGVFSDIRSEAEVYRALDYVQNSLNENKVIVEKHISGLDYRIYVVGDKVAGAILRVPPNVIGDGVNSIYTLIEKKNKKRRLNPRLISCPILLNQETIDYLKRYGYTLQSIPKQGEVIYLNDKANVSIGGDPIDVLDDLSADIKITAINALKAIPNFPHGAVDIIVDRENKNDGYVIELNPTAQIGGILFPLKGQSRDVPSLIIDYYFPETKGYERKDNAYFDFSAALRPLMDNAATVTQMISLPINDFQSKKFFAYGDVDELTFHQTLKKEAFKRDLIGAIKLIDKNCLSITLAGPLTCLDEYKTDVLEANERLTTIKEESNTTPVKVGFEIEGAERNIRHEIKEKQKRIANLKFERAKLRSSYQQMLNSTSWKITYPIRKVSGIFKKILK